LALDHGRILAVGHVEWFNARLRDAVRRAGTPRRIEVVRSNPRTDRGLDIDVVQDFMLHDLDWVARIVRDDLVDVEASGRMVVNRQLDEAEADLLFASGIRVRLRVSRVDSQRTRSVRIEGSDATVDVDLLEPSEAGAHEPAKARNDGIEPLDAEWADFLDACRSRKTPENDAAVGIAAIEMVERVRTAIAQRTPRGGGGS
jgi:predicted dehydrogenase